MADRPSSRGVNEVKGKSVTARPKKSEVLLLATLVAQVDSVDLSAPGGVAYAAHMLRAHAKSILAYAEAISAHEVIFPEPEKGGVKC